jgi:hypothetical protein
MKFPLTACSQRFWYQQFPKLLKGAHGFKIESIKRNNITSIGCLSINPCNDKHSAVVAFIGICCLNTIISNTFDCMGDQFCSQLVVPNMVSPIQHSYFPILDR